MGGYNPEAEAKYAKEVMQRLLFKANINYPQDLLQVYPAESLLQTTGKKHFFVEVNTARYGRALADEILLELTKPEYGVGARLAFPARDYTPGKAPDSGHTSLVLPESVMRKIDSGLEQNMSLFEKAGIGEIQLNDYPALKSFVGQGHIFKDGNFKLPDRMTADDKKAFFKDLEALGADIRGSAALPGNSGKPGITLTRDTSWDTKLAAGLDDDPNALSNLELGAYSFSMLAKSTGVNTILSRGTDARILTSFSVESGKVLDPQGNSFTRGIYDSALKVGRELIKDNPDLASVLRRSPEASRQADDEFVEPGAVYAPTNRSAPKR